uniref:Uncharacterized protein n=1 Tax=Proboscia inermis TaxID=420281 RepID=A0A7S0CMM8_9STRA
MRVELEEVKSAAMAANLAAAKLSDIMDQLAKLKQDEMALKKAELDHMKKEEAWVEFVQRLMVRFEEQVEGLGEDFDLVLRVVDSPAVLKPHERKTWFGKSKAQFQDMFDPELRERVLKEHVNFFKERVVEMLNEVVIHTVSLGSMKDGIQRRCLTLKDQIGHDEVIAEQIGDGIEKGGHNTLEDLAKMLLSADASEAAHHASSAKMEKRVSLVEKQGLKRGKSERKTDEAGKSESRRSVAELSGVDEENIDDDDDDGAFSSWGNGAANTS